MKITLIAPPEGEGGKPIVRMPVAPPAVEYLAGLTEKVAPDVEIKLIDANREKIAWDSLASDLVGFTFFTLHAPWVYRNSDYLRKRGVKTIFGGIHTTVLPKESMEHADAILIGEAEGVWKQILKDAANNRLQRVYHGYRLPLNDLPHPKTDLLKPFYSIRSFFTSRGCPHHCIYCSVRNFFGDTVRHRPIDEVVNEVASSKQRFFINLDDNIWGTNINRSIELYKELSKNIRRKWWIGQADLVSVQHKRGEELLKWGRKAGLIMVTVGWESNNPLTLNEFKATKKQGKNRQEAIKKIRDAGIDVSLFIMLGSINDTLDDFKRALDVCDELNVAAFTSLLTPLPGTELYDLYDKYIFHDLKWDRYSFNRALFQHIDKDMTVENRERALLDLRKELFTLPRIIKRIRHLPLKGFPMAHLSSLAYQCTYGHFIVKYTKSLLSPQ